MTEPYSANAEAIEPTLIALMRVFASALREIFRPTGYGSPAYKAELAREQELLDASEEAAFAEITEMLIFQWNDLERRAAENLASFSHCTPNRDHRADTSPSWRFFFLDDPSKPTHLHGMHATWFHARGDNGRSITSLADPANQAAFEITRRCIARARIRKRVLHTPKKRTGPTSSGSISRRAERASAMDPLKSANSSWLLLLETEKCTDSLNCR